MSNNSQPSTDTQRHVNCRPGLESVVRPCRLRCLLVSRRHCGRRRGGLKSRRAAPRLAAARAGARTDRSRDLPRRTTGSHGWDQISWDVFESRCRWVEPPRDASYRASTARRRRVRHRDLPTSASSLASVVWSLPWDSPSVCSARREPLLTSIINRQHDSALVVAVYSRGIVV